MAEIIFVTGNKGKFEGAKTLFLSSKIRLVQRNLQIPEIQSSGAEEIAKFSAETAGKKINKPLFVLDRSFHINALNGFPGPYVKYINSCLTGTQILKMIDNHSNRKAFWTSAIGCYIPEKGIKMIVGKTNGKISKQVGEGQKYMVDKIFIPEGKNMPLSELSKEERRLLWNSYSCWQKLIDYLTENLALL